MKRSADSNLTRARYSEFLADIIGACLISLGIGALFATYLDRVAVWLILVGLPLHGWGMYKIHRRNKS